MDPTKERQIVYLAGTEEVRWQRPVVRGAQLAIRAELPKPPRRLFRLAAKATVDGQPAASAEITCQLVPAGPA